MSGAVLATRRKHRVSASFVRLRPQCQAPAAFSSKAEAHRGANKATLRRKICWASFLIAGGTATAWKYYTEVLVGHATSTEGALSPSRFLHAILSESEPCGYNSRLLTLTVPKHLLPPAPGTDLAPVWSLYVKDDDIQVERPYTPLYGLGEDGRMTFWIKAYEHGEVGRWLLRKQIGSTIEVRGPVKTFQWRVGDWDEIVMISGGTGVTPFVQLLNHITADTAPTSSRIRFTLLHSSKTPDDMPPKMVMDPLLAYARSNPDRLRVQFFVDSLEEEDRSPWKNLLRCGRIGRKEIEGALGQFSSTYYNLIAKLFRDVKPNKSVLFVVCGPEPMINAIAGARGRNLAQGAVGGVLGQLGFPSSQVIKL